MLILTASDVRSVFGMSDAFSAVEKAAIAHARGETAVPRRSALAMTHPAVELLVMPGVVGGAAFGLKTWYTMAEQRPPLPRSSAIVTLLLPDLGIEAVLDAGVITDLRTGAMTGLAAQRLAPDARTAAVVGTGIQARTQALALAHACPALTEIRVTSRDEERRKRFARSMQVELDALEPSRRLHVTAVPSAEAACVGAEVVVAATTSSVPVIDDEWVADGALVCGVGSHDPQASELDPRTIARASLVVVDTRTGGIDGAGDISGPIRAGAIEREQVVELGDLLSDDLARGGVKVFKSVGFAAADVVAGDLVVRRALEEGRGTQLDLHG